ncbi:ribose-5-phosphate isomerase RpiA [Gammaproteobacteria bacterium]|nr:ribose-5-phosphate isomerase RpiA [Gammaproteobacteria bacterium]MDA7802301.1 ribose-5-phosphate isomerase RpiA [Gammaproteobacteria bacterium]MDA7818695.1 ribose-5-phosphate isomerase RpiA [Gammaproteobacteria bacterium]MDA7856320.1 ribose-5-phosphate isomerase RpiA [Gammaproteobacteria bacterium]MDA8696794.1 ribose-5-phosphate isomerase RpiA [Gammaproteobacteria bacterium]
MSGSKINVAKQAVDFLENKLSEKMIIGIGTGTTVNFFIEQLKTLKHRFDGAVSSSDRSSAILQDAGIKVYELNGVNEIAYYVDGADEVSKDYSLIKGGGGAHTREKIVASASEHFICIVDKSKIVNDLGAFPLPIEVIPESRSLVSRKILSLGGIPTYRQGFTTDQGNQIIDVTGLDLHNSLDMEYKINGIAGVVDNGIFAINKPKTVLISE